MFSFFKKTLAVAAPTDASSAQIADKRESIPDGIPAGRTEDTNLSASSFVNSPGLAQAQPQLRAPSPPNLYEPGQPNSAGEPSSAPGTSNARVNATTEDNTRALEPSITPRLLQPTPEALDALIQSVPAKTLHSYILAHLTEANEPILQTLAIFFEKLTPPPKLHCVRCHKDYTEVENDDRSCLVPHDDESAEVERVGLTVEARRMSDVPSSSYRTLWGCCDKVTEGDGSHGPPDGWCYEGRHTVRPLAAPFPTE